MTSKTGISLLMFITCTTIGRYIQPIVAKVVTLQTDPVLWLVYETYPQQPYQQNSVNLVNPHDSQK